MSRVIVGISGGVDSAVAALLLKREGHEVLGVFMRNWEGDEETCSAEEDGLEARLVADKIGIPLYSFNFTKDYMDRVFKAFLRDYQRGFTPNPDILCNREIKFKAFLDKALELDADFIATGHYVRNRERTGHFQLLKGLDPGKDQSYFLYAIDQVALSRSLFPVGHLQKSDVRRIAKQAGLPNWQRKDSVGICFIGQKKFKAFLEQYLGTRKGIIEDVEGHRVGTHTGLMYHTIGQRRGLGIGGPGEPWYVVGKDVRRNVLIVAQGGDASALYAPGLVMSELTTLSGQPLKLPLKCRVKIRYRQDDQAAEVVAWDRGRYLIRFQEAQRAISPGQSAVLYRGDVCLGGGLIEYPCRHDGTSRLIGSLEPVQGVPTK